MVHLNPVPVFGTKNNTSTIPLTENFLRNFRTNGKRSITINDQESKKIQIISTKWKVKHRRKPTWKMRNFVFRFFLKIVLDILKAVHVNLHVFFCLLKKAIWVKSKQFVNWTVGLCFLRRSRIGQCPKMINILSVGCFMNHLVKTWGEVTFKPNLSDSLVRAKLRNLTRHNQPRGSYPCGKNCLTCKYISDGQTSYTCHSTG